MPRTISRSINLSRNSILKSTSIGKEFSFSLILLCFTHRSKPQLDGFIPGHYIFYGWDNFLNCYCLKGKLFLILKAFFY